MNLNDWATLFGVIFGFSGLALSVLHLHLDRPKLRVTLQWDMKVTDNSLYDPTKDWGVVSVTNVGRRPAFVQLVVLELPKGFEHSTVILMEGVTGTRLGEGDAPKSYIFTQEGLEEYAGKRKSIRAVAIDSTGHKWVSRQPSRKEQSTRVKSAAS